MPNLHPWKWNVTIYDRRGWSSMSCNHQPICRLEDGRLAVQIWSTPEDLTASDFWKEELDDRWLTSEDGGKSWQIAEVALPRYRSVTTPSGRTISITTSELTRDPWERREHLERVGLGHLYRDSTFYQYQLWPESMRDDLVQQGFLVHDSRQGVLATCTGQTLCISEDGGRNWSFREVTGLPFHAKLIGFFRDPVVTRTGAIVGPCWGMPNPERKPVSRPHYTSYCLRSEDDGESWELVPVGHDPEGPHSFDEAHILLLESGQLLMMMRHQGEGDDRYLYQSTSVDEGRTWSNPERTEMWGFPPHLIQLRNGNLLCSYTHRRLPYGVRACLSFNEGKTWDVANEKVIRDDSVSGAVSYPTTVEMGDGTLFMAYGLSKTCGPLQPSEAAQVPARRMYVAGSRFREDFV